MKMMKLAPGAGVNLKQLFTTLLINKGVNPTTVVNALNAPDMDYLLNICNICNRNQKKRTTSGKANVGISRWIVMRLIRDGISLTALQDVLSFPDVRYLLNRCEQCLSG